MYKVYTNGKVTLETKDVQKAFGAAHYEEAWGHKVAVIDENGVDILTHIEEEVLDDYADEWRPGDAPWNAPGMSVSDFIR